MAKSKGVLGNDPFLRGAAQRKPEGSPSGDATAEAKAAPKPEKPEQKNEAQPRDESAVGSGSTGVETRAQPEAGAREVPPDQAITEVISHGDSPELVAILGEQPVVPHAASPDLVTVLDGESIPHAASPDLVAIVDGESVPHSRSPELIENRPLPVSPEAADADDAADEDDAVADEARSSPVPAATPSATPTAPGAPRPDEGMGRSRVASAPSVTTAPSPSRPSAASTALATLTGSDAPVALRGALGLLRGAVDRVLTSPALSATLQAASTLAKVAATGLGARGSVDLDEYGKDEELVRELEPVTSFFYNKYWRVTVEGAELVPSGPVLLVANHSGALPFDGPVLQQALLRERPELKEARWLVEDQIFHAPVVGTLMNRLGAIRACPENALRLLDERRPVIVFPEGVQGMGKNFRERYQLKRFGRGGFVKIAFRTGVPIVPVAVVGAEESSPLLGRLPAGFLGLPYLPVTPLGPMPLPARWYVRFGDPLKVPRAPNLADDLAEVQRWTERTRESIQGMLGALLEKRSSIFY